MLGEMTRLECVEDELRDAVRDLQILPVQHRPAAPQLDLGEFGVAHASKIAQSSHRNAEEMPIRQFENDSARRTVEPRAQGMQPAATLFPPLGDRSLILCFRRKSHFVRYISPHRRSSISALSTTTRSAFATSACFMPITRRTTCARPSTGR